MNERISLLVNVKAYPAVSEKYGEVVCVAGIRTDTEQPTWARLFPVAFRDMPFKQRFKKYQHVTLEASRHSGDARPETYRPNMDTIQVGKVIETKKTWAERRQYIEPLIVESMCAVQRQQEIDGTSLGAFRPGEVLDLVVDAEADDWDPRQGRGRCAAESLHADEAGAGEDPAPLSLRVPLLDSRLQRARAVTDRLGAC